MRERLVKIVATFLFVGYLPLAPGTWGSLAGLLIYLSVKHNMYLSLAVFFMLFFLGFITAGKAEKILGEKDDKRIVIDEVCGMLLIFTLIQPSGIYLILGFILFRIFDVIKLYPANKAEKLPGSLGVMADDIIAALFASIALGIIMKIVPHLLNIKK